MTRVLSSYARELKNMKRGPVDSFTTLTFSVGISALVTGFVVHKTFEGGLPNYLKLLANHVYWYQFKHADTDAGLLKLKDKSLREFAGFLTDWKRTESLNSLYLWTVLGVTLCATLAWVWLQSWRNSALSSEKLRSGEQPLVSSKELSKLINLAGKSKGRPHTFREHDVVFGNEKIRVLNETIGLHLGIGGASQTGKTNAINQLLESRRTAGEKVLIVDPGGEFYARFGQSGDTLLSLHDKRTAKWDFWSEGVSEEEMAKALVEVRDGMDASTKFFQTTGRAVLTSLFRIAGKHQEPLRELWRLANLSAQDLELILKQESEISHRYLGQGDSGQAAGVIATSLMNLEFLKHLNGHVYERESSEKSSESVFSIRTWILNEKVSNWVFLVATDSHWEQTRPLIRLWFDIASTAVLERNTERENLKPLWLVCDEVSTVGLLPTLPKLLDRGYKYSGRLVLGFQSLAQINQIYGIDAAHNIMQGLQNLLIFACNESKMAQEFSERLGKIEVEEYESSVSPARGKNPERVSISTRQRERKSVTESEIRSLPENSGYLKLARFPPTKIEFAYKKYPNKNDKSKLWSEIPKTSFVLLPKIGELPAANSSALGEAKPNLSSGKTTGTSALNINEWGM